MFRVTNTCGPSSEQDVLSLEGSLGHRLPDDYRAFLLTHNARQIRPCVLPISGFPRSEKVVAHEFTCFCPNKPCDFGYRLATYSDRVPKGMLPIASDPGGNLFLLSLSPLSFGEVSFWERAYEVEEGDEPTMDNVYSVAASFTEFLSKLVDD